MALTGDVRGSVEENAGETSTDGCQLFEDMPGIPEFVRVKRKRIEDEYKKKKTKLDYWIGLDNTFKMIQRVAVAFAMTGAAVIGVIAGVEESPTLSFIAGGLASFSALKEPLSKLLIKEFTTKKRLKFLNVCKVIRDCMNEMYLSYIEAKKDGEISVEEVRKYQGLIQAMEDKLFEIETGTMVVWY